LQILVDGSEAMEQLRAICRSPRPTSSPNLRTSLVLRTDNLLAGKRSSLSWGGYSPLCCPTPLARWKLIRRSRTPFRDRPKTVRIHPIRCLPSSRNRVHFPPESPATPRQMENARVLHLRGRLDGPRP
jgi:hypothetical protein